MTSSATIRVPLIFRPVYRDYIWGGDRILHKYGRAAPPGIYAESWEISARPEGMSVVAAGPWAGQTLQDLIDRRPADVLGAGASAGFPLLIKLIDARERLSVQVHPDETAAARHGGEPKTEAWYILEAQPGAQVFAGLKPGLRRRDLEDAIRQGRVEETLTALPVQAGDTVFIPGGLVHALDAGILLLEVQQNSNTTYRLYDWDRVGHDGRPRAVHVAEALRTIRWDLRESAIQPPTPLPPRPDCDGESLIQCRQFQMERWRIGQALDDPADGRFRAWFVVSGTLRVAGGAEEIAVPAGTTFLLPAALEVARLVAGAGGAQAIRITVDPT